MQCYLLATKCLSLTSDLSNQMWGEDFTMALWTTPINPPCTCPTCQTGPAHINTSHLSLWLLQLGNLNQSRYYLIHKVFYHGVAAVIGQDDNVNGCCVIGHTDAAILWFVLSEIQQDETDKYNKVRNSPKFLITLMAKMLNILLRNVLLLRKCVFCLQTAIW